MHCHLFTCQHSELDLMLFLAFVLFVTRKSSAAIQEVEEDFDMKQHVDSLLRETGMAELRPRNMSVDDLLT